MAQSRFIFHNNSTHFVFFFLSPYGQAIKLHVRNDLNKKMEVIFFSFSPYKNIHFLEYEQQKKHQTGTCGCYPMSTWLTNF